MIIPIFIYRDRRSDKEIREDIEREAKWRKLIEEDELRERRRKEEETRKKLEQKRIAEEKVREEVEADMRKNPWDYKILPEGWSIFGQRNFGIISE